MTLKRKEMESIDRKIAIAKKQFYLLESNFVDVRDTMNKLQKQNDNNLLLMDDGLRKEAFKENAKNIINAKDIIKTDIHGLSTECKNINISTIELSALKGDIDSVTQLLHGIKPIN